MAHSRQIRNALAAVAFLLAQSGTVAARRPQEQQYALFKTIDASNFFDEFNFFESTEEQVDPTHGYVQYRNKADAQQLGLAAIKQNAVYLGVDATTANMDPGAIFGRSSVRLESLATYRYGLFVWDIAHFPGKACGVWPAMWMYGEDWPNNGEVDVYENWNDNFWMNRQTLHTRTGCKVLGGGQTNRMETIDCDVKNASQPANFGCSSDRNDGSWGSSTGGIFAMQWTRQGIQLWNWGPNAAPADLAAGKPRPALWGTPNFNSAGAGNDCPTDSMFGPQWLVFNTVFCGDAAAADEYWKQTACFKAGARTCQDYVANNPVDFAKVYWLINSVKIYTLPGDAPPPPPPPGGGA